MTVYAFEGRREQTGELIKGTREAPSHTLLGSDLLSEGVLLTRYEEKKSYSPTKRFFSFSAAGGRVPILERVMFARYFGLMLRAGFDAKRALGVLQEQTSNRTMRMVLETMHHDIDQGKTLAECMERFPRVFPQIFLSFVRVGETTGRLQESLGVLAVQLQKDYDLRRTVRGAMLYPAVIVGALGAVGFAMLVFVVPKLAEVFEGFNVELPLATRVLLKTGTFFENYWYLVIVGMLLAGAAGWLLFRWKPFRSVFFRTLLYVPLIGPIMQKVNLARFNRNFSSLLRSGMAFAEAIAMLGQNTPHPTYASVLQAAQGHIKSGKPLSEFLAGYKRLFPALIVSVVKIGEETGELDKVLEETAIFFENEVDQTMKNLTSILEPVLMVIIGLAVGALAISIISPIYSLVSVI